MSETETLTVTLTLDNDKELECSVLTIFEAGDRQYIALLPLDKDGRNEDGKVFLYRFSNDGEDEDPKIENIIEDEEYDLASEAFNDWMDEQEFGDIDLDDPY